MELIRSDFSKSQINYKKQQKKKLFNLIKHRRNIIEVLSKELNIFNSIFFTNEFNVDVNVKLSEIFIYSDPSLPMKEISISDFNINEIKEIIKYNNIKLNFINKL